MLLAAPSERELPVPRRRIEGLEALSASRLLHQRIEARHRPQGRQGSSIHRAQVDTHAEAAAGRPQGDSRRGRLFAARASKYHFRLFQLLGKAFHRQGMGRWAETSTRNRRGSIRLSGEGRGRRFDRRVAPKTNSECITAAEDELSSGPLTSRVHIETFVPRK